MSKDIRRETGELFYGTRALILHIKSPDPNSDELAFTLKLLRNILTQHGPNAFTGKDGGLAIAFPTFTSREVLARVAQFVHETGMVLGGPCVVGIRDCLAPSVVGADKAVSDYIVYQAVHHDGRRDVWPSFLLAMALVGHSRGWDEGFIEREWKWLGDVVRAAVGRVGKRRSREVILLAVEGEARVLLGVVGNKVEVVRTVRMEG